MRVLLPIIILLALPVIAKSDDNILKSYCTTSMPSLEQIRDILKVIGPLDGKDRVQCGLPGEEFKVCLSCSEGVSKEQMAAIGPMLADREHRDWHKMWHTIRGTLKKMPEDFKRSLIAKGWIDQDITSFVRKHADGGSLAGEDFFFMHREMIKMVQARLVMEGLPCIAGWPNLPDKVDSSIYTVTTSEKSIKNMLPEAKALELQLRKPENLKRMSLNDLAKEVRGFHNYMHIMWSNGDPCENMEDRTALKCNGLLPLDSAPLNPHFWKLHGLTDNILGDWMKANGYTEISKKCEGRDGCYEWKGTWLGKIPPTVMENNYPP